ncbi:MAG TPA: hypothetical protein VD978_07755 [Azospirillum sp.]|nr:hypothetical protein [Azospirillum sp.]
MSSQFDLKRVLAYIDERKKEDDEARSRKVNVRAEEDAKMIEQIFVARGRLATGWLTGVFVDCLNVPKEGAKSRVSAALRKLVAEGRIKKIKQGIYEPATL